MDKPSTTWKEYLDTNHGLDGAAKASYTLWLNKYAKPKAEVEKPEEKIEKFMVPGKIYTFAYISDTNVNKKNFVDHRPILFSLGATEINKKIYETGINFNTIPPKIRVIMLDRLYKYYKSPINENEENINEGKKGKKALKLNYKICDSLFNKLGWQMSYMIYDKSKMQQTKVIDYSDWVAMIPLHTKAIRGKQINEIYNEYIKNITNPKI